LWERDTEKGVQGTPLEKTWLDAKSRAGEKGEDKLSDLERPGRRISGRKVAGKKTGRYKAQNRGPLSDRYLERLKKCAQEGWPPESHERSEPARLADLLEKQKAKSPPRLGKRQPGKHQGLDCKDSGWGGKRKGGRRPGTKREKEFIKTVRGKKKETPSKTQREMRHLEQRVLLHRRNLEVFKCLTQFRSIMPQSDQRLRPAGKKRGFVANRFRGRR